MKHRTNTTILPHLFAVEWYIHGSAWSFRAALAAMFAFGMLIALAGNFSFANAHKNSPFVLAYVIGFLSLVGIFPTTLFAAQALLKEHDAGFSSILTATPLRRREYLVSRFGTVFGLSLLTMFVAVIGLAAGHIIAAMIPSKAAEIGALKALSYLHPFALFIIPNTLVCTAIVCAIGWTLAWRTRSRLFIFLAGLLLYVLYFVGSIASNSPFMANAEAVSAETMRLTALFDPFAMATLFEQTAEWTAHDRNTRLVELGGTMLLNRLLWSGFALALLTAVMLRFRFEAKERSKWGMFGKAHQTLIPRSPFFKGANATSFRQANEIANFGKTSILPQTPHHFRATIGSFLRLDAVSTFRSVPFLLLMLLWTFFICVEIMSAVQGGIRLPARYASTTLMVNEILTTLPAFALFAVLFFSNEILWRSNSAKITPLEDATPLHSIAIFCAKLVASAFIPFVLVVQSIVVGVVCQIIFGYPHIYWGAYASLLYVLAFPLALCAVLAVSLQTLTKSRYTGLTLAVGVFLLTSTPLGRMLGVRHPLLRFAAPLTTPITDMSGFDNTIIAFHAQMLWWSAITLAVGLLCSILWKRSDSLWKFSFWQTFRRTRLKPAYILALTVCLLTAVGSGGYILYQMHVVNSYRSTESRNAWAEQYERRYRPYQTMPQPAIRDVETTIHLYPQQGGYVVQGRYTLVNRTTAPLDTVLISLDKVSTLDSVTIPNARCVLHDTEFGQYLYKLTTPLQAHDSLIVRFQFHSMRSPFAANVPFNSITRNGAFMRISRYFPVIGYQASNELTDTREREKRGLPAATPLQTLEEYGKSPQIASDDGINLDATISTDAGQIAVGVGELDRTWLEAAPNKPSQQRRYFRYRTRSPIPFRFAVSSARYAVVKETYKRNVEAGSANTGRENIALEIYYHPDHAENVPALVRNAKETLAYCEKHFGQYPHNVLRFAETTGFAAGFAATSYPATIFMNENQSFHADMRNADMGSNHALPDVINELAGHEVSHQWWGGQLIPAEAEGAPMLTETFAMYTELMLYEKMYGSEEALAMVKMYRDFYVSGRGFESELPLYRSTSDLAVVHYDKGVVIMHQLRHLLGEERVNTLLRTMLRQHSSQQNGLSDVSPKLPPTTLDFLRLVYAECPSTLYWRLDQMFKEVIVHDAGITSADVSKNSDGTFKVRIIGALRTFSQNSKSEQTEIFSAQKTEHEVEIAVEDADGKQSMYRVTVVKGKVDTVLQLPRAPIRLTIDPRYLLLDINSRNNEYSSFAGKI